MSLSLRDIMRLTPSGALDLNNRVRSGDVGAARDFVLYAVWRQISADKGIPSKMKPRIFTKLADSVNVTVENNG